MKKFILLCSASIFAVSFAACSDDDDATKSDPLKTTVNRAIIDLPGCISAEGSSSKVMKTTKDSNGIVNEVYEGIRENVGAIDEWTGVIKEILINIYKLTENGESGEWTDSSAADGEPSRVVWSPDTVNGYETKVDLYWGENTEKGFEAYVTINKSERTAKGVITWDFAYVTDADTTNDNLIAQFIFDSTVEPGTLEIKAVGMDNGTDPEEPENAWLYVTLDENHVFTLAGNYYFDDIDLMDNGNPEDRNYVFTVVGYDEEGMDSDHVNQAILNLAVPLAGRTDVTGIWTEDSVGATFCEAIKTIWNDEGLDINDLETWTGLSLPATFADFDYNDVIGVLEFAANHTEDSEATELLNLLFVINLVNPAYYMENGFFGTWDDDAARGTLNGAADIPASFDGLTGYTIDMIAPSEVRDLAVDFL